MLSNRAHPSFGRGVTPHRRTARALLLIALAPTLVSAACGGSSSDDTDGESTAVQVSVQATTTIATTTTTTAPPQQTYAVQQGDVLGVIAEKFGIGLSELMAANDITDPDKLQLGQVLVIPDAPAGTEPEPAEQSDDPADTTSTTHSG